MSLWRKGIKALIITLAFCLMAAHAYSANDYPHFGINNIGCDSCHFVFGTQPSLLPEWTAHTPQNIDDTQYNTLCWSCHNDVDAPYMRTHSSLQIDNSYGDWTVECRVCHNPHFQKQFRTYGSSSYLYSGASTGITASTLTKTGAGWTENAYQGYILCPNVSQKNYNYEILSNTSDTLTVQGPINLTKVSVGNTFAIIYGNLINDTIDLSRIAIIPSKSGSKATRFFNSTGTNSFADGNSTYDGMCEVCHTQTNHFRNNGTGPDQLHANMGSIPGTKCTNCHKHENGFRGMGGGAHTTHVLEGYGPELSCSECHGANIPPVLADGQNLANTTVCNNCHSTTGAVIAKTYWGQAGSSEGTAGSWALTESDTSYCGSCHDSTPGNTKKDGTGDTAPNVMGNGTTYGYAITGHGKTTGNFSRLSWQDTSAAGNPAANRQCSACHNLTSQHFNNSGKRLKTGYENDNNSSNCKQCHNPGTAAVADPQWYTTYADYQNSAHSSKKCSACHDVHGASGAYIGMTKLNQESLCNQASCHSGTGGHPGVGSTSFVHTSKTYTLECVSCHNVHLVSGTYSQANLDKSPVTLFSNNTELWGDDWNEKMDFYAGGGTYRTPTGESFTGAQLPDYASFCTDCHGQGGATNVPFGINWNSDPHGKGLANQPNGYGTCPNWFACGNATGWADDDCTGSQSECWPVKPKGAGDELYSREAYTHTDRVAGANFVLSCTDCHTGHGSGNLGRSNVNGGSFTGNWNSMCNNCHYYYSDWHAGMACGNASCHISDRMNTGGVGSASTPHQMANASGSGGTRTFNPDLVLDYRFENNLKDSGGWEMDGKWNSTSGSFTTGKSGQAAVLGEDIGVQVGTENSYWSTDAGYHNTWKYTEMKYNTTLEAWVYPTDSAKSEYTIFNKHVGYSSGGYGFSLKKIGGVLKAAFNMQADNNSFTQGGAAGVRGAYSSVAIPLNKWTHVAASFDTSGVDRNPSDPSAGRIRIYVNGEDVTTSDSSGNNMQPGANETSIFAYSENSPWNEGICYNGTWCASEFAIGGFDWEATNYIGRIDEAKVWNVTKNGAYFSSYDSQAGPYISSAVGLIGDNQITVTLSEGVYTTTGASGALISGDFTLTDTGGNNPRTITGVTHTAGTSTATVTMSHPLTAADVNADTMAAVSNGIYDEYNNAAGTETVTIGLSSQCPTSPVTINLNEASGSTYIRDTQNILYGVVYGGASTLTGSAYSGGGDGSGRYIMFDYNTACLQASTAMTVETRIKPTGLTTENYIGRILARDGSGNFQFSIWRNNTAYPGLYNAPSGEASIALWIYPVDAHGGNTWKPVLTNYTGAKTGSENNCPVVSDHWYLVKAVWNTNKPGGTPGQFFQPADIYMDDQGTDGNGAGENWAGYINCTDSDQSLKTDAVKFYTGDVIKTYSGDSFAIGTNRSTPTSNLFNGLIDWITWKDSAG